ncbi:hypothetical protein AWW72_18045 [Acinetobacter sp. NRRL B-65365]|uniref:YdaS family helix-turn-helix protein n=1 Tax=Acinetobacter sp. NRRL B-65365 TaxID=1785092 RepID=UPI0007A01653|nr:YdaS family helix-turn-helix protein [Acinetobacter sp. NRRL B-65365]KYQ82508.1 hypothetical protein AWW72_18045 [Acinetobacter sp. NRRL B-65365]
MNNILKKTDDVTSESIVKDAIQKAGGVSAVARLVTKKSGKNYSYQAVQSWISQDRIPPKYIPIISDVTGIAKSTLDPIVFQGQ